MRSKAKQFLVEVNSILEGGNNPFDAINKLKEKDFDSFSDFWRKMKEMEDEIFKANGYSAEAGFDNTGMDSEADWKDVLKAAGVKGTKPVRAEHQLAFLWQGKDVMIFTGANPLDGGKLFKDGGKRNGDEFVYVGKIGLQGKPAAVKKVADKIKSKTDSNFDPKRRQFI